MNGVDDVRQMIRTIKGLLKQAQQLEKELVKKESDELQLKMFEGVN